MSNAETLRREQYKEFVDERLVQGMVPLTEVIGKNKLAKRIRPLHHPCLLEGNFVWESQTFFSV